MHHSTKRALFATAFLLALFASTAQTTVSPNDFGLREATTGIARYYALYNTHTYALQYGAEVTYDGIDTLHLELPPKWRSIPLGTHTDFGHLVLYVTNHAAHGALFSLSQSATTLDIDKQIIDGLDYTTIPQLAHGTTLLVLNDKKPWTERRGYGYMAYRSDVVVVRDGHALNSPVMPWDTDSTQLSARYYSVDTAQKSVRGLTLHRVKGSQYKTYCLSIVGQYNVVVEDMHVTTPRSRMIADGVFSVSNSANITMRNITVEGTYSGYGSTRNYGYAFSLDNNYNTRYENIRAHGNWGVFGTNNLHRTTLVGCDLDRFDIHCYGRDVSLVNCTMHGRQTIFGSMYGTVSFDSCRFDDYVPVRIRSSYNAYTPFDVVMHNCTFRLNPRHHAVVSIMLLDTADNPRPELREKCWPNLYAENLTIVAPWTVGTLVLYDPIDNLRDLDREIGYLSTVHIDGLHTVGTNGRAKKLSVKLFSHNVTTRQPVDLRITQ